MSRVKQILLKEIDPLRDFETVTFQNHYLGGSFKSRIKKQVKNISYLFHFPKKTIRGSLVSGLCGAFVAASAGGDIQEGFAKGAAVGAYIDTSQYMMRFLFLYAQAQIK